MESITAKKVIINKWQNWIMHWSYIINEWQKLQENLHELSQKLKKFTEWTYEDDFCWNRR